MKDNPLVSIITPCFNCQEYLPLTIESVLAQNYSNWELILVDDCSSDHTPEVVNRYVLKDSRIKGFKTANNTGSPAIPRNIGLNIAKGKYIALLDSDDIWYPEKLSRQVDLLESKGYALVYSNGNLIDENGNVLHTMKKQESVDYSKTLRRNEMSCSSAIMLKDSIGDLRFENIPKEDFVFWLQLFKSTGLTAYNTNSIDYAYRILRGSRSRNKIKIIQQQWWVLRKKEKLNVTA